MAEIEVLSPEGRVRDTANVAAPRLPSLAGVAVALHDNAKPGALELLAAVGRGLEARGARLRSWHKPHAARPSHHLAAMAGQVRAAVFALGD